ncbi:uncharacterized protein LOC113295601 [Papaver somniferum]|uniref:uncharacterized protein LOC113295601 n=1 Tax=Papaver somniferum TaxID=3469 RepID=UPI000E703D86|nr:uncharacterized protein LOC113295601 [Papaver somniferum]
MTEETVLRITNGSPNPTFAEKVKVRQTLQPTAVDVSSLPNPTLINGEPSLVIPTDFYQEGCKTFEFSFIARLNFKGLKFLEVKNNLVTQWQLNPNSVRFMSISKGFFVVMLRDEQTKARIRNRKWFVNQQELRLMDWYPGFDPERQNTSHAPVWVHLPGLHEELWTERSLLSIGKAVGNPIVVDQRTLNLEFGSYASVLVDVDFVKHIPDRILLTAGGRTFWQYVEIPKHPKFYLHCNIIGHNESECRRKPKSGESVKEMEDTQDWQAAKGKKRSRNHKKNNNQEVKKNDKSGVDKSGETGEVANTSAGETANVPGAGKDFNIPVAVGENVAGKEDTSQLEEVMAASEAQLRAAYDAVETAKQALALKRALANILMVDETTIAAKSGKSDELARTNHSSTDRNQANSSTSFIPIQDAVVHSIAETPIRNALADNTVVISLNKFDVLTAELGLSNTVQQSNQEEESSNEELTPEKASAGVKGAKWSEIPVEKVVPKQTRKPGRVPIQTSSQSYTQNKSPESKYDSDSEVNDLGIRVSKGFSPVIEKRVPTKNPKISSKPKKTVS